MAGSLFIALGLFAAASARTAPRYDGHWWLSVSEDEQSGFLNGYADCYIYEYKGPAKFTINPPDIARGLVTKFYRHNASRLADPVASALHGLRDRPGQKSAASDGQPIRGRHGFYRGLYWGELYDGDTSGSRTSGKLGYVQGYLDCHARLNHNKGGVFSKPPSDYVKFINRWYGLIPHNETYLLKRESVPIADVLFKFRDGPQRSKLAPPRP